MSKSSDDIAPRYDKDGVPLCDEDCPARESEDYYGSVMCALPHPGEATDGGPCPVAVKRIQEERDDLRQALLLMVDPEQCRYSKRGDNCVVHGPSRPCPEEVARKALRDSQ